MHDIKSKDVHIGSSMAQNSNSDMSENQNQLQTMSSQWTQVIGQLVEKFMGKNMSMTYNFENLEIDIPRAQGPGGRQVGGAKWTINGRIVINTETHDARGGP